MASRNRHKKEEARIRAEREQGRKRAVGIFVSLLVIFTVAYLLITNPPPVRTLQCFENGTKFNYQYEAKLFIRVGPDSDNRFIEIPPVSSSDLTRIGILNTCRWPITTGDYTGSERGANWTKIHIDSPYRYTYTLGDFFFVWSATIGATVNFGPDGVSNTAGPTYVSYNFGPEQRADLAMLIRPNDWIVIRVYP